MCGLDFFVCLFCIFAFLTSEGFLEWIVLPDKPKQSRILKVQSTLPTELRVAGNPFPSCTPFPEIIWTKPPQLLPLLFFLNGYFLEVWENLFAQDTLTQ